MLHVIGYENVPNVYVKARKSELLNEVIQYVKFADLMSDLEMVQNLKCFLFLVHCVSLF